MVEVIYSGVDWVTFTLPIAAVESDVWSRACHRRLEQIAKEGSALQGRAMLGFSGFGADGCFVGISGTHYMSVWAGHHAHRAYQMLYRPDVNIPRIDLQVTVRYDKMPNDVAITAYEEGCAMNDGEPGGRRRKLYLLTGSDGGDTCYVGAPSSAQRARIYNKERQSEDPKYTRCWRFEVQLRNERAMQAHRLLEQASFSLELRVTSFVSAWMLARGITVPWTVLDDDLVIPPIRTLPTDIETKLNWLKNQVRPTVKFLMEQLDRATILEVLGL